jgi:hypothetical protein
MMLLLETTGVVANRHGNQDNRHGNQDNREDIVTKFGHWRIFREI